MEKENISSMKMTFKFILHFILYSIIMIIITGFIYSLIYNKIKNVIITSIISTILSCVSIFIATKLSVKDIFADKTLDKENMSKYKRNIIIFFVICILINIFYYAIVYSVTILGIDKMVNNLQISSNQDITGIIEQAKNVQLIITCIVAVIKSFVYVGMIKYQNKYIDKIS